ncbi:MAG: hypothetical protein J0M04_22410 [Verrucomicrobia bacterium]|nr:hypothetical protein [Verrucomicrobiota bacterium]
MKSAPKSNTWVVFTPTMLWFGFAFAYTQWWQSPQNEHYDYLVASGLGIPFIATGVAQCRSRYLWQNLSPGNRGSHQSERPQKFVVSTVFNLILGLGIVFTFVILSANERANKASLSTPAPPRVQSVMTIPTSTHNRSFAPGQV